MKPSDLLQNLGQVIGLPGLNFDEHGTCRLEVGGNLLIDLEHTAQDGLLHLYAVVGTLPETGRDAIYEKLLAANLFGAGTQGASLAVDIDERQILLCRQFPEDQLEPPEFQALLERFVLAVKFWTEELAGPVQPKFESMQAETINPPEMLMRV